MSTDRTTLSVPTQEQAPELAPVPTATLDQAPESTVPSEGTAQQPTPTEEPTPDQVAAATEEAAKAARKAVERDMESCVDAYVAGEQGQRPFLVAGYYAARVVARKLAMGDSRAAGVQAVGGQLALHARAPVDVNRLIGCWHAYRLLALSQGLGTDPTVKAKGKTKQLPGDKIPYTQWREMSRLTVRVQEDTPEEDWVLLPGLEQEALDLFRKAAEGEHATDRVKEAIRTLESIAADRAVLAAKAEKERLRLLVEAEAEKSRLDRERAKTLLDQANAAKAGGDNGTATVLEGAAHDAIRDANKASSTVEKLEAKVDQADALVQAAEDKATKKRQQAANSGGKKTTPPAPKLTTPTAGTPPVGEQPPLPTKAPKPEPVLDDEADSEEIGVQCAAVIAECDAPDDAVAMLLDRLVAAECCSRPVQRELQNTVVRLRRLFAGGKTSSPAEVTVLNGVHA